ncbi:3,4-dihydroxy-2-butanone 4-phosphate synthase [Calycina marina]|uniref:3,4-dihydroxy-2-butanone 4-phosphate synthase n=1 Tax=Calycina marina TaxID=1763456 RepID=A0A9P7YZ76_9HELO|nr:3,4-dihydroxy-2-butanone 4-phosphate synthase [Calycina marina]
MPSKIANAFDSIEDTIEAFKTGNFIVVLDDLSRENEGDLIIAAEDMTTEKMAFMVRYTSGIICTPMLPSLTEHFDLPQMVTSNEDPNHTAYTVTIDANLPEITTGISAHDRALTVRTLAGTTATKASFRRPGHVLPLKAKAGGVRERVGHTEAAVEICRLAGKVPVGAISEIVDDIAPIEGQASLPDTGMLRRDGCLAFGKRFGLKVCTIEDLVAYVEKTEGKLPKNANGTS